MFLHNFKYTFKTLFKNKSLIFWTFAFPLILGTLFNMAFSNISDSEKLKVINIAIIDNEEYNNNIIFNMAFKELSKDNENKLFNIDYVTKEKADELLDSDKIIGYLEIKDDKPYITYYNNGINQTIFKYVVEEINEKGLIINDFSNGELNSLEILNIYNDVEKISKESSQSINDISNKNLDYVMIEFYTLIAMTCLYGGMLGMYAINQKLANMGNIGKRISVSPTKKSTLILSSLLASYLTQLIGLALLFSYTIFVLNINYGDNIGLIILLSIVGSFVGLTLGTIVGALIKTNHNAKIGILIAITMFGCFLSGMMGITMKYIIDKHIPFLNKINPASMITDGFYALYYYDTLNRYWFDLISLLVLAAILVFVSIIGLRRQKYDNI